MHQQRQFSTLPISVALVALLLSIACNSTSDSDETVKATADAPTSVLGAAGSTFIAPLMTRWVSTYQQTHSKVQINYRPIGSGAGIDEMKQGFLSFAASDAPLSDDQMKMMNRSVIQVPASAGPVCIVYNLPNLSAPLRLSARSLSGIYLGNIISWQDSAIARDNPGVKLPRAAVVVVHRSDSSGTTDILTSYLSKVSHDWESKSGRGLSVPWPIGLGVEGSKGILAVVKQTPGTIGYLELNYAKENGVPVASIQNQAGRFVQPTPASTAAAITAFSDALAKDVRTPIVDPPASVADAYTISGLTFILLPKDRDDIAQQEAIKDFIAFAISTGQDSAEELSYAKLPDSIQKQGQGLLSQLTVSGQPLK